jgi:cytochrome c biogenesis factor
MDLLWLGYDGLAVPYTDVVAVLLYQPALDARIARSYGSVPLGVRAVVVTGGDVYWPSRWEAEWLRRRLADWRGAPPPLN